MLRVPPLAIARRGLEALHQTRPAPPGHVIDQLEAAHTHAFATIRRIGDVEQQINPDRWWRTPETSSDTSRIIDIQARVMAAMGDGRRWTVCVHLRRTSLQTSYVQLPIHRIDCERCAATLRLPPPEDDDRCDLCGRRGITTFWPLRVAVVSWIVLGDTCRQCARELHNPAAA